MNALLCCMCLQDNLLPITCEGKNWQGGVGLTLVDSLDMLLLLNRRSDVQEALKQLEWAVSFDKDEKVRRNISSALWQVHTLAGATVAASLAVGLTDWVIAMSAGVLQTCTWQFVCVQACCSEHTPC